jgi:hypothetical protein
MFEDSAYKVPPAVAVSILLLMIVSVTWHEVSGGVEYLCTPPMSTVRGELVSVTKADAYTARPGRYYRFVGSFRFVVNGTNYSGSQFGRLSHMSKWKRREADSMIQALTKATWVDVQYDPANPSHCFAIVADESSRVQAIIGITLGVGLIALFCAVLWLVMAVRLVRWLIGNLRLRLAI